jgi:hypothetical protein
VFRRWLMLLRDGPDLLAATSLDVVAQAAERCDCDFHTKEIHSSDVALDRGSARSNLPSDTNRRDRPM